MCYASAQSARAVLLRAPKGLAARADWALGFRRLGLRLWRFIKDLLYALFIDVIIRLILG